MFVASLSIRSSSDSERRFRAATRSDSSASSSVQASAHVRPELQDLDLRRDDPASSTPSSGSTPASSTLSSHVVRERYDERADLRARCRSPTSVLRPPGCQARHWARRRPRRRLAPMNGGEAGEQRQRQRGGAVANARAYRRAAGAEHAGPGSPGGSCRVARAPVGSRVVRRRVDCRVPGGALTRRAASLPFAGPETLRGGRDGPGRGGRRGVPPPPCRARRSASGADRLRREEALRASRCCAGRRHCGPPA